MRLAKYYYYNLNKDSFSLPVEMISWSGLASGVDTLTFILVHGIKLVMWMFLNSEHINPIRCHVR